VRADADQVSAETLGFLPDTFGNIAFLDYGDLSLDSARGGVRRHLRTQELLASATTSNDRDSIRRDGSRMWSNRTMPPGDTAPYA
jgi:hypothetical protein